MRALLIGAEGNLGLPLSRYLSLTGHEVICADIKPGYMPDYYVADINHPLDLLTAFERMPDVVYLLAGMVSRVTCEQASSLAITTNLAGANNIIQLCRRFGARLVYFSSSEVYGPGHFIMDEHTSRPNPINRYGLTKYLTEQIITYEAKRGLDAVILRPFMIYGPDEDRGDHRSAIIRFAENLAWGEPITVHKGTSRGWLFIDDAIRAFVAAADVEGLEVINIGHPDIRPMVDVAELIRDSLSASANLIRYESASSDITPVKIPNLERQERLLGFRPKVSLEDGIKQICRSVRRELPQVCLSI